MAVLLNTASSRITEHWTPDSWRSLPASQLPRYADPDELARAEHALLRRPPLVPYDEVFALETRLAAAARGDAFLLQGGDCAERITPEPAVGPTCNVLDRMADILVAATSQPVVVVARMAGQLAKPRSDVVEHRDGLDLPVYRGDAINDLAFTPAGRLADPRRMLLAHEHSARVLAALRRRARRPFVCHEALLLPYEEASCRPTPAGGWYLSSAHFLWLGDRTRQRGGAHIELLRGILNPIGIKLGPTTEPDELVRLAHALDPTNRPGRLTFIVRMGASGIQTHLPSLVRRIRREGLQVGWVSDPMHGNTVRTDTGLKTRHVATLRSEVRLFLQILAAEGVPAAGIHLEMTGDRVTECVDASLHEHRLHERYTTACDPRLNDHQAIAFAAWLATQLSRGSYSQKETQP